MTKPKNTPPATHSITDAINGLGEHDDESIGLLWNRFFDRLAKFADKKVFPRHARFYDGEDIAASALYAVLDGMKNDRFERPGNRNDLWSLLVVVASRKAINRGIRMDAQKRDDRRTSRGSSAFVPHGEGNLPEYLRSSNDPAKMYEFQATCKTMLNQLPDDSYRQVALLRMAGYTNEEIAKELECATRTVERKLVAIRKLWTRLTDL